MPDTPAEGPVTVRVTLFADPINVPEDEVPVLRAQGLLVEDTEPQAAGAGGPSAAPPAAKSATAARKDASS